VKAAPASDQPGIKQIN